MANKIEKTPTLPIDLPKLNRECEVHASIVALSQIDPDGEAWRYVLRSMTKPTKNNLMLIHSIMRSFAIAETVRDAKYRDSACGD